MKRHRARSLCCLGILLLFAPVRRSGAETYPSTLPAPSTIDSAVWGKLAREGEVGVLARLRPASVEGKPLSERIATYRDVERRVVSALKLEACEARYAYRYSPGLSFVIHSERALRRLGDDPRVLRVRIDLPGGGALDESRSVVGADELWESGLRGAGRVVAVLDSGVDTDHPDFAGRIIHQKRFTGRGLEIGDSAEDDHGHGTNVTGIIASAGNVAPRGVAPAARIVAIKVLDEENRGWISDWAAGVEHVIDLHLADNGIEIDAINMSLVSDSQYLDTCDDAYPVMTDACRQATDLGIAVFVASGNTGSISRMSLPACLGSTISVGSVPDTRPDVVSSFTSRNQDLDLLAPGEAITSTGLDGGISTLSGTSQATPHATGIALLIAESSPGLSSTEIRELLRRTGKPVLDSSTQRSYPRIDGVAAVNASRIPSVEEIACGFESAPDRLVATWRMPAEADRVSATVSRDGVSLVREELPREVTSLEVPIDMTGLVATTTYDLSVSVVNSGLTGPATHCAVAVSPVRPFVRGDCTADQHIDITDPIRILLVLFAGNPTPFSCADSCDLNDDGLIDISDSIYLLAHLFLGSKPPPSPYPSCGDDSTPDDLPCEAAACGN